MTKHAFRVGAVALASAAAMGAVGAGAGASTPSATPASLSSVQAKAAAAITLRVNDLNAAMTKVDAAKSIGAGAPALLAYLQADIAPLQALGQKIATDPTVTQAQSDTATIYTNFRVLALVLPAAHLAGTTDGLTNATIPGLTADSAKAVTRVTPTNQATLQPLISDLNNQIAMAASATSGLTTAVLADTPAQWNANHDLLSAPRSSFGSATVAVKQARTDLQQIRADLKAARTPATTPTTSG